MVYELVVPNTRLAWFHPDKNGVTVDDLVEVALVGGERLYFRYDIVVPGGNDRSWHLDKALLPDGLKKFLDGAGMWYLQYHQRNNLYVGGRIELEHTQSQVGRNGGIDFTTHNSVESIRPVSRSECVRSAEIHGHISVYDPDGFAETCITRTYS